MMLRQGDVFLVKVKEIPDNLVMVADANETATLALGEVTGHHHSIFGGAMLFRPNIDGDGAGGGTAAVSWLEVIRPTKVDHQEHTSVPLKPGKYRVEIQRQYTPEAIKNVQD